MFGPAAVSIKAEPCHFNFRYRSVDHFLDVFKTFYGPMHKAFAALNPEKAGTICRTTWSSLVARMNKATDGTMVVPSELPGKSSS